MPYIPKQCDLCGAGLDPGEHCDCQAQAYCMAHTQAKAKLARIIMQEGDANGARLLPQYLDQLTREQLCQNAAQPAPHHIIKS